MALMMKIFSYFHCFSIFNRFSIKIEDLEYFNLIYGTILNLV